MSLLLYYSSLRSYFLSPYLYIYINNSSSQSSCIAYLRNSMIYLAAKRCQTRVQMVYVAIASQLVILNIYLTPFLKFLQSLMSVIMLRLLYIQLGLTLLLLISKYFVIQGWIYSSISPLIQDSVKKTLSSSSLSLFSSQKQRSN